MDQQRETDKPFMITNIFSNGVQFTYRYAEEDAMLASARDQLDKRNIVAVVLSRRKYEVSRKNVL